MPQNLLKKPSNTMQSPDLSQMTSSATLKVSPQLVEMRKLAPPHFTEEAWPGEYHLDLSADRRNCNNLKLHGDSSADQASDLTARKCSLLNSIMHSWLPRIRSHIQQTEQWIDVVISSEKYFETTLYRADQTRILSSPGYWMNICDPLTVQLENDIGASGHQNISCITSDGPLKMSLTAADSPTYRRKRCSELLQEMQQRREHLLNGFEEMLARARNAEQTLGGDTGSLSIAVLLRQPISIEASPYQIIKPPSSIEPCFYHQQNSSFSKHLSSMSSNMSHSDANDIQASSNNPLLTPPDSRRASFAKTSPQSRFSTTGAVISPSSSAIIGANFNVPLNADKLSARLQTMNSNPPSANLDSSDAAFQKKKGTDVAIEPMPARNQMHRTSALCVPSSDNPESVNVPVPQLQRSPSPFVVALTDELRRWLEAKVYLEEMEGRVSSAVERLRRLSQLMTITGMTYRAQMRQFARVRRTFLADNQIEGSNTGQAHAPNSGLSPMAGSGAQQTTRGAFTIKQISLPQQPQEPNSTPAHPSKRARTYVPQKDRSPTSSYKSPESRTPSASISPKDYMQRYRLADWSPGSSHPSPGRFLRDSPAPMGISSRTPIRAVIVERSDTRPNMQSTTESGMINVGTSVTIPDSSSKTVAGTGGQMGVLRAIPSAQARVASRLDKVRGDAHARGGMLRSYAATQGAAKVLSERGMALGQDQGMQVRTQPQLEDKAQPLSEATDATQTLSNRPTTMIASTRPVTGGKTCPHYGTADVYRRARVASNKMQAALFQTLSVPGGDVVTDGRESLGGKGAGNLGQMVYGRKRKAGEADL